MAIISQKQLFGWNEVEELGDLERLRLLLEYLPDEGLMQKLEAERGRGRNDYPVRPIWNSILAGIVFGHESIASLRRELLRNAQLRCECGFSVLHGAAAVPPAWAFSRFMKGLMDHQAEVDVIFDRLVDLLEGEDLEGFGEVLAIDGKAIDTHARKKKDDDDDGGKKPQALKADGRRDIDADVGVKRSWYEKDKDGKPKKRFKSWFGYELHLVVDATSELPVAYEVTRASRSEMPEAHKLLERLSGRHKELLEECEYLLGDRGYDDGKLVEGLWDDYEIKPVVDIRDMWDKKDDPTRLLHGTHNVVYDYRGTVSCHCPETGLVQPMVYGGFEKDRETLKYLCPARHHGIACAGMGECKVTSGLRIKLSQDRRIFTPLARSTYSWEKLYKKRASVERVNSRLDVSFGFERHFIRGLKKMKLRVALALIVMNAMALGRIKQKQPEKIRSLVAAAA